MRLLKANEAKTELREATQLLKRLQKDQKEINLPMGLLEWTAENRCHTKYPRRCFRQLGALKLTQETKEVKMERPHSLHCALLPKYSSFLLETVFSPS